MKLKLQKVKSYSGIVRATQKSPYVTVDAETGAKLVKTGYFVEVSETEDESEDKVEDGDESEDAAVSYEELAGMSKAELAAYAEQNGISTDDCKTKADILKAISVANGGNSTMIDLQSE